MTNRRAILYVGNIPYALRNEDLVGFLAPRKVLDVNIVCDSVTKRPRGFAFIEMEREIEALDAIKKLHLSDFGGRRVVVKPANERKSTRW